ncbi:MAG: tetraacyldisaccharide 4'-kinase [Bdellovibrionales bacterium]|nr:tetraacyldisaccharide 4'-kinase [Bdellovibrionales bacterium]
MNPLLLPPAMVFQSLVGLKNLAYNLKFKAVYKLPVPVVSVGNLTVGGTGKTPLILELLHELRKNEIEVGVISRGYKSGVRDFAEVELNSEGFFGDEPTLVKSQFPEVPFFISADRMKAGSKLLEKYPDTRLLLADDAFQHRRLHRDFDIVVLDATRPKGEYQLLPAGRAREGFGALQRADAIVLSKLYMPGAVTPNVLYSWIEEKFEMSPDILKVETQVELGRPEHVITGQQVDDFTLRRKRWILLSAIGNPDAFEASVKNSLKLRVDRHKRFADHHDYTKDDLKGLLGKDALVLTTSKDAIKLKALLGPEHAVYETKMDFDFLSGKEDLLAKISGLVAPAN